MAIKLEDVMAAAIRLKGTVHHTDLIYASSFSQPAGCEIYIKPEFLQKTGSFKARGAFNFCASDSSGVGEYTTYSSGNHGQAMTWAAVCSGKKATVFMPENASPAKVAAVRGYGGEVRFAGFSSADRWEACTAYAAESGAQVVPPYDHEAIIAGQGTCMLEVLKDLPHFDAALIPVGGGGLLGGCSLVLNTLRPGITVYACEAEAANDVQQSLKAGELRSIDLPDTIADGMRNLVVGDRNWEIIRRCVHGGLTCSEEGIREAMRRYATYTKSFVEPTGAVTLACLTANRALFKGKKVVLVASGGNIAIQDYARLISENGSVAQ